MLTFSSLPHQTPHIICKKIVNVTPFFQHLQKNLFKIWLIILKTMFFLLPPKNDNIHHPSSTSVFFFKGFLKWIFTCVLLLFSAKKTLKFPRTKSLVFTFHNWTTLLIFSISLNIPNYPRALPETSRISFFFLSTINAFFLFHNFSWLLPYKLFTIPSFSVSNPEKIERLKSNVDQDSFITCFTVFSFYFLTSTII